MGRNGPVPLPLRDQELMEAAHPLEIQARRTSFWGCQVWGGHGLGKEGGTLGCTFPLFTDYRVPDLSFSFLELCGEG